MALVASVRVAAYYKEELSVDLAKMLPFALLGVFLVDISFFSVEHSKSILFSIPQYSETILYYLIFTIVLEFLLRILFFFFGHEEEE